MTIMNLRRVSFRPYANKEAKMEALKFIFISSEVSTVRCNIIDREKMIYYFQWQIYRTDCCPEYLKRARVVNFNAFFI